MRIGLINMDPVVARAFADKLCGTRDPFISPDIQWSKQKRQAYLEEDDLPVKKQKRVRRPSTSDENYALLMRKRRDDMVARRTLYTSVPSVLCGLVVGGAIWFMLQTIDHHTTIAASAAGAISVIGIVGGRLWAVQANQRKALDYEVLKEELKAAAPYLKLSRAERVYCDILIMLSDFEANLEARKTIRRTLGELNAILVDSRRLEKQRKSLLPALGNNPVKGLQEEQAKLEQRISDATDEVKRKSLEQSLVHVTTRIENSRSLEQALERINAQEETIVNALSSSLGALARMQVAPSIQTETAAREITETVEEMNRTTVAVEQAVKEVLLLR